VSFKNERGDVGFLFRINAINRKEQTEFSIVINVKININNGLKQKLIKYWDKIKA